MRRFPSWLRNVALSTVVVFLVGVTTEARAEEVDWSQYIDDSPPRRVASESSTPAKAKQTRAKRGKKVAAKSKSRVKARAKKKARRK